MFARRFHRIAALAAQLARAVLTPAAADVRPPDRAGSGGTVFRHYL